MSLARWLQATKACTGVLRRDATRRHARVAPPRALRSSSRLHKKILRTVHLTAEAHVQASVPSSRSWSNRLEWSADRCCEAARVVAGVSTALGLVGLRRSWQVRVRDEPCRKAGTPRTCPAS